MEIQAPFNNVFVTVESKYVAHFSKMLRGASLNPGTQVNPADYVQMLGTVVSVPKKISNRRDYIGFSFADIQVGDKCIMRYDVVYSFVESAEGTHSFRNNFWYKGVDYWAASIDKIFGVIRDGKIIMINGYCMIQDMEKKPLILTDTFDKRRATTTSATLVGIGNNLTTTEAVSAKQGDRVYYNPAVVQSYKINDKQFGIISQKHILGSEKDLPLLD